MPSRNKNRPILKIPLTPTDKIIEGITLLILFFILSYTYYSYTSLPEIIPVHFNYEGRIDTHGHKSSIWGLPICSILLYLFMTIINRYPQFFNYPEEITDENAEDQYTMGTKIVRYLKLSVVVIFGILVFYIVRIA
ncbi:MAG: DUF1648 domain-containing protein [Pyrinomonadaceae bacterium]|nr:DUF1648 domain-containing protein [Sphingobacteriaceae bacterium]